jgi:hypothetical protein
MLRGDRFLSSSFLSPPLHLTLLVFGVLCQMLLKHDLASTCEILDVELPLQGCKIGGGIY